MVLNQVPKLNICLQHCDIDRRIKEGIILTTCNIMLGSLLADACYYSSGLTYCPNLLSMCVHLDLVPVVDILRDS